MRETCTVGEAIEFLKTCDQNAPLLIAFGEMVEKKKAIESDNALVQLSGALEIKTKPVTKFWSIFALTADEQGVYVVSSTTEGFFGFGGPAIGAAVEPKAFEELMEEL